MVDRRLWALTPGPAHHPEGREGKDNNRQHSQRAHSRPATELCALQQDLLQSSRQPSEGGAFVSATLQMGKLRRPRTEPLAQGHMARKLRTQVRGLWRLRS